MYAGYWLDKTFFSSSVLCWSSNKTAGWRAVELCNDLLPSPQMLAQGHSVLNSLALCHPFHFFTETVAQDIQIPSVSILMIILQRLQDQVFNSLRANDVNTTATQTVITAQTHFPMKAKRKLSADNGTDTEKD